MNLEELKRNINHSDPEVRRKSAEELIALNYYDEEIIEAYIQGITSEDKGFKDISFSGLSSTTGEDSESVAQKIIPLIKSSDLETRNLAGEILLNLNQYSENYILELVSDDDYDVRKFAIDLLGLFSDDVNTLNTVLTRLNDKDANVVLAVIETAGNIISRNNDLYNHSIFKSFVEKYNESEDYQVQIIEAFGKFQHPDAEQFLYNIMKDESNDDIFSKIASIDALANNSTNINIVNDLLDILEKIDEDLQPILLKTIFAISIRIGNQIELPMNLRYIAHKALMDNDEELRAAGLIALNNEFIIEDVPYICNELKFFNPETAQHILYVLFVNSDKTVIDIFTKEYTNHLIEEDQGDGESELFTYINNAWMDAKHENKEQLMNTICKLIIENNDSFVVKALKIIYDFDELFVQSYIDNYKSTLSENDLNTLNDLVYFAKIL